MHNETDLLSAAAKNNAELCELVCVAHGVPGEFRDGYWTSRHEVAKFYPNFITVDPTLDTVALYRDIDSFESGRNWAVKDSYSNIDLSQHGFKVLFSASWLVAPEEFSSSTPTSTTWKVVDSVDELKEWEAAWADGQEQEVETIFKPALLQKPEITFIIGYQNKNIVAGAVANLSETVVGYSNLFVHDQNPDNYWIEMIELIRKCYPGKPIVGYEHGDGLATALRLGFTILGDLNVWIKSK